jgi:hypothetical protein
VRSITSGWNSTDSVYPRVASHSISYDMHAHIIITASTLTSQAIRSLESTKTKNHQSVQGTPRCVHALA